MKQFLFLLISFSLLLSACTPNEEKAKSNETTHTETTSDFHSYSNYNEIKTNHLHLDLDINFNNKTIYGIARHEMSEHNVDHAIFDIKGLEIIKTTIGKNNEEPADFIIGEHTELLGQSLTISITPDTKFINIYYKTSGSSEALDWLSPEQTTGKKQPYLYTQGQAILNRSWIPLQDTPMNRITYSADVKVPKNLIALMSANNPIEKNETGEYHFEMKQKIPSYLIALAVGDLVYTSLGENCGVYSEKELADDCAYEFVDLPKMIEAASSIYGEYQWEQYDIVMLPYSFPFGGMENPRLTFANPTILTGDRSSTSVVAHELAHSWSGNLVTNSNWDDFWLNEGFTVYFENRIMEKLYGKETADILAITEYQDLVVALEDMEHSAPTTDSKLKLDLKGRNPDDGMTDIAYVKGAFFLRTLEREVGREKLDVFLNQYFIDHSFQSITTEVFVKDLNDNLLNPNNITFDTDKWIYEPGIPEDHVKIESERLDNMITLAEKTNNGENIFNGEFKNIKRSNLTSQEWLTFIRTLKSDLSPETMAIIDDNLYFSTEANDMIKSDWFKLAAKSKYRAVQPEMEKYLIKIGRRWFIEGIYQLLMDSEDIQDHNFAKQTFEKAKNGYHFVSRSTVEEIVK